MEEIGRIIQVVGDRARIGIKRTATCDKCEAKGCCLAVTPQEMVIEARNEVGAKEGEMVKISLESKDTLAAGAIVYLFPLLSFFLGFGIGALIAKILGLGGAEALGILTAFGFLIISYVMISRFYGEGSKSAERFTPVIKEIIKPG